MENNNQVSIDSTELQEMNNENSISNTTRQRLIKYHQVLKGFFESIRIFLILAIIIFILTGLIYNIFATSEKDLSPEYFKGLLEILKDQATPKLLPLTESQIQWKTKNLTKH